MYSKIRTKLRFTLGVVYAMIALSALLILLFTWSFHVGIALIGTTLGLLAAEYLTNPQALTSNVY